MDVMVVSSASEDDFPPFLHLRNGDIEAPYWTVWCYLQVFPEEFLAEGWLEQNRTGRDHASN